MSDETFNPLDKASLAKSIELELLARPVEPLKNTGTIIGAGVYVIYYNGSHPAYRLISEANKNGAFEKAIYVGKAIPKGGRKGGIITAPSKGRALADRLRNHASTIDEVSNLSLDDFYVRHLVVDDIWIPLGENMLIETFQPVWNRAVDGFGNKDPGQRRKGQYKSPWDVVHPGRLFAVKLADNAALSEEFLLRRISDYFAKRPLEKLPKVIEEQQDEEDKLEEL